MRKESVSCEEEPQARRGPAMAQLFLAVLPCDNVLQVVADPRQNLDREKRAGSFATDCSGARDGCIGVLPAVSLLHYRLFSFGAQSVASKPFVCASGQHSEAGSRCGP